MVESIYLDLDMSLQCAMSRTGDTIRVIRIYCKPGNAYPYIPFTSFHGRYFVLSSWDGNWRSQASDSEKHARTIEGGGEYVLPPPELQRIPAEFPQDSLSRGHTGEWSIFGPVQRITTGWHALDRFLDADEGGDRVEVGASALGNPILASTEPELPSPIV